MLLKRKLRPRLQQLLRPNIGFGYFPELMGLGYPLPLPPGNAGGNSQAPRSNAWLRTLPGRGLGYSSSTPITSYLCFGLDITYLSDVGRVHFAYFNTAGAGFVSADFDSANVTIRLRNEDYRPTTDIVISNTAVGRRKVYTGQAGFTGSGGFLYVYTSDGEVLSATGVQQTRVRGTALLINDGNGYTGMHALVHNAWYANLPGFIEHSVLIDLAKIDGVYAYDNSAKWVFDNVSGGYTHPTLSNATATDITTTGFRPRVTYTF